VETFAVDIEKVLRDKAGDKAKYVPRFVVAWLKHIIHQDEINQFFEQEGDTVGLPWLEDALKFLDLTLEPHFEENLAQPNDG
jgi:hypothetical protein